MVPHCKTPLCNQKTTITRQRAHEEAASRGCVRCGGWLLLMTFKTNGTGQALDIKLCTQPQPASLPSSRSSLMTDGNVSMIALNASKRVRGMQKTYMLC